MATTAGKQVAKKSGMRTFKAGEVIFNQSDPADSLFIIQKGQIRLYIPKGRGFVDLAILRSGEVIGEMGYFDEKAKRRSCSAAAIVSTEVIEISYNAFGKTMAKRLELYKKYLSVRDELYLNWSTSTIVKWEQKNTISNISHIHGTKDPVFPIKNIDNCIIINEGTHNMIINKSEEIKDLVLDFL